MINEFPKISVIVPAYNVESYIESAIDSLLNQSVAFYEIIVINDGSTDSTKDVLKKYEKNLMVKIYHTENHGLGMARNRGIKLASGNFLYFFDSDDILDSSFSASILRELQSDQSLDLIFFSGKSFYDEGFNSKMYEKLDREINGKFDSGLDAANALYKVGGFLPHAFLYISRKSLWNEKLCFLPILHEDAEIILKLCVAAAQTKIIDVQFLNRRLRHGSIMTNRTTKKHMDGHLQAFKSVGDAYILLRNSKYKYFVGCWLIDLMWRYIKNCETTRIAPNTRELFNVFIRIRRLPIVIFRDVAKLKNIISILRIIKWNLKKQTKAV
jgi:glycosyltransferase involved in cell wall biosynthesis